MIKTNSSVKMIKIIKTNSNYFMSKLSSTSEYDIRYPTTKNSTQRQKIPDYFISMEVVTVKLFYHGIINL